MGTGNADALVAARHRRWGVPGSGREHKVLTAIVDHSRLVVAATVLLLPSGPAVCDAFLAAIARWGAPFEVLTDNGKQFTGKFTRPLPVEVLFERICREHGIAARLAKRRSPTTTGKIERFHRTLRRELLDETRAFESIEAAQAAIDEWVHAYNTVRPHQSLGMATPASLFRSKPPNPTRPRLLPPPAPARTSAPQRHRRSTQPPCRSKWTRACHRRVWSSSQACRRSGSARTMPG